MTTDASQGKRMIVWAVTGPAGAGKSAVSAILARLGAAVVDGDRVGHELLARPEIQAGIVSRIGPGYVRGGEVDRAALGARVFSDPEALVELNAITHPALAELAAKKLANLALEGEHELAVFEAAVYFLLPSPPPVDLVVAVMASPEVRIRRLVERAEGRMTVDQARRRVEAQDHLEQYWPRADELIVNDGTPDELETSVLRLVRGMEPGSETQS